MFALSCIPDSSVRQIVLFEQLSSLHLSVFHVRIFLPNWVEQEIKSCSKRHGNSHLSEILFSNADYVRMMINQ